MYTTHFGLKEKPFRLVPDPEFLFLSTSHEEALAHLTYAVSQQEGFVEVTGEVGTGKTTLCRSFLENLDQTVESAFIFNPKLDADQLLKAILAELDIACPAGDAADMTHALYEVLLEKKIQGKSVILLIDEAQNLSRETLEQLRLLSNLETTRSKLLQIILVGQPELSELLNSHEMRQLRQRISLSCRIMPLSRPETFAYITHRVSRVSLNGRELFTHRAVDLIYRYSGGIPRLINILCDRSLVAAFGQGKDLVFPDMVKAACKEVNAGHNRRSMGMFPPIIGSGRFWVLICTVMVACLSLVFLFSGGWPLKHLNTPLADNPPGQIKTPESVPSPGLTETSAAAADSLVLKNPSPEKVHSDAHTATVASLEKGGAATPGFLDRHEDTAAPPAPEVLPVPQPLSDPFPVISGIEEIRSFFVNALPKATREKAFSIVLSLWRTDGEKLQRYFHNAGQEIGDARFFEVQAWQRHLEVLHLTGDKDQIKIFNLPAILTFSVRGQTGYLAVIRLAEQNLCTIACESAGQGATVGLGELTPFLGQDIFIVWRDPFGYSGVISPSAPPAAIISLKLAVRQLGFQGIGMRPQYDIPLVNAVKTIQARYGLVSDGLAGPMTKIAFFHELEAKKREETTPVETFDALSGTKAPK